jgi:hypothetical protein
MTYYYQETRPDATITAQVTDASYIYHIRYSWNSNDLNSDCTGGGNVKYCYSPTCSVTTPAENEGEDNEVYACTRDSNGESTSTLARPFLWKEPTTPPDITISGAGSNYNPDWSKDTATIEAQANDGARIEWIRYSWNSNDLNSDCTGGGTIEWCGTTTCTETTKAPDQGTNRLYACAYDDNSETDNTNAGPFFLDETDPSVSATDDSNWIQWPHPHTATVQASDSYSGIDYVRYRWDNSNNVCSSGTDTYNGEELDVPIGDSTLHLCARDEAGNTRTWSGRYLVVTSDNPTVKATDNNNNWYNTNRRPEITATDRSGAGLDEIRYSLSATGLNSDCTGGTKVTNGQTITISNQAENTLYLCASDNAGNEGFKAVC